MNFKGAKMEAEEEFNTKLYYLEKIRFSFADFIQ